MSVERDNTATARDWSRIELIFGQALTLPAAERDAFLDRRCAGDPELHAEIAALLAADAEADGFLAEAAALPQEPHATDLLRSGDRLGSYLIKRPLGHGGMGSVFLAERADQTFTREVAIKVLRHGSESASAAERLQLERQILADLDHPGIARLLDGGTTPTGLPFLVMERAHGEPLDVAAARLELSIPRRLEVFLAVCDAVSFAHRQLVVHRDLKPSNILLDDSGKPKLLDFGIAKLLADASLGPTAEDPISPLTTASWDRKLTPSYASPEQLRGERITVATDVYQLGVVLYKLLTGQLPYRFESRSLLDIERTITRESPPSPSSLARGIAPDLDAIVLKALRADPESRYLSVEALAEDLRRFQQSLPVLARQGAFRYVSGKFLRRHRLPLAVVALLGSLLAAFTDSTLRQAQRIERTASRLAAMEGVLFDLFWAASPEASQGRPPTVAELLERGERRLRVAPLQDPGAHGSVASLFGRIALHLGRFEDADKWLVEALDSFDAADNSSELQLAAARAKGDQALLALYREENYEQAERLARQALESARGADPKDSALLFELTNNLAGVYCWWRRWEPAEQLVERAAEMMEDGLAPGEQVAIHLSQRALLTKHRGQTAESRQLYQRALELFQQLEGEIDPDVGAVLHQLGLLARDDGDLETAGELLSQSLAIRRQIFPIEHWVVAQNLFQLAAIHHRSGDLELAEDLMQETLDIYLRDPARGPTMTRTVYILLHLAELQIDNDRHEQAEATLAELPESWWTSEVRDPRQQPWARAVRARIEASKGHQVEAKAILERSHEQLLELAGESYVATAKVRAWLEDLEI
ncbi:MAG: serine/threonine-protein kinase [Acidobacteriota bacterium]